ncbi:MAG: site-specific integrase [Deltaproteobacteria bacterium]|nr:site-specific integrase [Deltaproteobacteria bacterium]
MLEHYFTKPETVDQIRELWVGEPIEQYVIWLAGQGYAARTVHRLVPIIRRFGEIAWDLGARNLNDLPAYVEPFIEIWMKEHKRRSTKKSRRSSVCRDLKSTVERFLKIVVPEYTGNSKQRRQPFSYHAPAFFSYLRNERGLSEISLARYFLHLRRLEKYLAKESLRKVVAENEEDIV